MSDLREQIMYELTGGGINTDWDAAGDKADEIIALVRTDYEQKVIEAVWRKYRHVLPHGRELTSGEKIHNSAINEAIEAIKRVMEDE